MLSYLMITFQFQTGSIKSVMYIVIGLSLILFQFQTGSIKRQDFHLLIRVVVIRFNSKLVRLKEMRCQCVQVIRKSFNSKLVRLKAEVTPAYQLEIISFNSKLVRLKGFPNTALILYCTLTVPVKLIFIFIRLEGSLLSTSNRANSLGG